MSWRGTTLGSCAPSPHPGLLALTLHHLVVGKMQIEQEEHVQSSQGATEEQPLRGAHSPGHQHCHLEPQEYSSEGLAPVWGRYSSLEQNHLWALASHSEPFVGFCLRSGLLPPPPQEDSPCPAYHAQGGQPPHQQPEEVEEGVEVDVIGDEQDNAVPEQAIALGRRMVERKIIQAGLASGPSWRP